MGYIVERAHGRDIRVSDPMGRRIKAILKTPYIESLDIGDDWIKASSIIGVFKEEED